VEGRGSYVDDIVLPGTVHAAFLRSPHAHARIVEIDAAEARRRPGVLAVLTGRDLAKRVTPWRGILTHIPGLRSAPQHVFAIDRACWQGEPVVVAVADTRAHAEDAIEAIRIEWEQLPAVTSPEAALAPNSKLIHADLGTNLAFERRFETGDLEAAAAAVRATVEREFCFDRQTGVTPEPRAILADFSTRDEALTVYHSGQTPHVMQALLAKHLGLSEQKVRVVCKDVGGAYGIKIHLYGDEIATVAAAILLRRPVKFVADRLESFLTDIHARGHRVRARMGLDAEGRIASFEVEDVMEIGAYSAYPRASVHEVNQLINMCGASYLIGNYRASGKVVFQNKNITSQFRAVGHPMLTTVCEGMIDAAAVAAVIDPAELRRRNLIPDDAYPRTSPTGRRFDGNSHHACLEKLVELMDYRALREEQATLRGRSVYRGIGLGVFVESTGPGPTIYGSGDASISAQDSSMVRLEPSGAVTCASGVTEQGQGTEAMLAQITADAVGVPIETVHVVTGDTDRVPYGGGTWGSRGAAIGGEATWRAGRVLRANILSMAGRLLQTVPTDLTIVAGSVVDSAGRERFTLAELARIAFYRSADLPDDVYPEFSVTRSFRPLGDAHAYTNGVHGSHLEVDVETGFIRLLGHWVVEDCGTMINPLLVEEQVRGGVALGLGWALLEQCVYDTEGQLLNGTMADYLVPMAGDLPDVRVAHVMTPTSASELGVKGAGESGVIGAPAAVLNAVNDALAPLGAYVAEIPITPRRILASLERRRSPGNIEP
jgi:carbon-monoxide dehydrogenase large subunit